MLKNKDIICISSIDWDFVWQGHQEIMAAFAKNGNRVLFIENTGIRAPGIKDISRLKKRVVRWFKSIKGFRKEMDNLYIYSPIILPFPYSRVARWFNRCMLIRPIKNWIRIMKFHDPIVWTFLPTGTALDIIDSIDRKLLVYYCIADFYELVKDSAKVKRTEDRLIKESDVIFAQGEVLEKKCRRLNDNVHIFPFGVNTDVFDNFKADEKNTCCDIAEIKNPVIGYIGGIHRHMDFELLKFIAKKRPDWSIVLVGPTQTDTSQIEAVNNIYLLGKKELVDLPYYVNKFDVGIIPYRISGYTQTVYPTKLNEYHIMGKPVVSTDLPEIAAINNRNAGLVSVGKTHEEFLECISRSLGDSREELVVRRVSFARENSWPARIEQMSAFLEGALEKKALAPTEWKDALVRFYRRSSRKVAAIALIALSAYFLLLHTPLVWFLGAPLKITDTPRKADVIVAFGGGVGETGKPGTSTIERARYAAELYNQGYADKIIFSSGYFYAHYNDAENMRLLALSMGVADRDIILEEAAGSTYENAIFSSEILNKNGWASALLVSSPYNMRRASMVFNRHSPDLEVSYMPVKRPQFYDRLGRVKLEQIKGIAHEYFGIIYYLFKGYI